MFVELDGRIIHHAPLIPRKQGEGKKITAR